MANAGLNMIPVVAGIIVNVRRVASDLVKRSACCQLVVMWFW